MNQVPRQSLRKSLNGIILILAFLMSFYSLQAQTNSQSGKSLRGIAKVHDNSDTIPQIEWQKCLGGGNRDLAYSIIETSDGGFVVAGYTGSNDGDVTGNHGDLDYWIVKLNKTGQLQWQKCLGGGGNDFAQSIIETSDGGFVVAGKTWSNEDDVSGCQLMSDYWIVKLDQSGQILWQKHLGGDGGDNALSIIESSDGGFVVAGSTNSNDGDVSGNHGSSDYWIVKLDYSGQLLWQKCLGGSRGEGAISIQETSDGGIVVAGGTASNDGDVSGNHGDGDYWIVKLDQTGQLLWQKCLGGSKNDVAYSIKETGDGGFVVAGSTRSNDGDVSGSHGGLDYWIVKLDQTGQILWQKCLDEGVLAEMLSISIIETSDGGYFVAGSTYLRTGNFSDNHGSADYLIVKLDQVGQVLWQKCLGGIWSDIAQSIAETSDGGFVVAGYTWSNDGDVTGHHGSNYYEDFWVVKLSPEGSNTDVFDNYSSREGSSRLVNPDGGEAIKEIYPNPSKDEIIINYELSERSYSHLYITNILGEKVRDVFSVINPEIGEQSISININDLSSGTYYIILETMNGCQSKRIEVVR